MDLDSSSSSVLIGLLPCGIHGGWDEVEGRGRNKEAVREGFSFYIVSQGISVREGMGG